MAIEQQIKGIMANYLKGYAELQRSFIIDLRFEGVPDSKILDGVLKSLQKTIGG